MIFVVPLWFCWAMFILLLISLGLEIANFYLRRQIEKTKQRMLDLLEEHGAEKWVKEKME